MEKIFKEVKQELQFEYRNNINFFAHIHEEIEVIYIKKGGGTAFCDGKKYALSDNSIFIVCPYQVHRYIDCIKGEYIVLVIKPPQLLRYGDVFMSGTPKSPVLKLEDNVDVTKALIMALDECKNNGYSGIVEGYLTAFFGMLLKLLSIEKNNNSNDMSLKILQYCVLHYHESITVGDIARDLNVSRSSVSHIFSKRFAINFCDYINSLRLLDAVELLKNKALSITDIAVICGFSNLRTFNRAFLKQYGVSPSVYRREMLYH